jgi:RND family efflux transporter MFP subunit
MIRDTRSILPASVFLATALMLIGCSSGQGHDPRLDAPFVQTVAARAAGGKERAFTGVVTARVQSNLGFRVPGMIAERLVDSGQVVRKGQALMRLDRTDFSHSVSAQKAAVAAARARLVQAAADEERLRGLVDSGAISQTAYDQARAAADGSRATVDGLEAQLQVVVDNEGYSTLVADSDGVIAEVSAEPGQVVAAGQIVVKLAHAGAREAAVYLPETLRPQLDSPASAAIYGEDSAVETRHAARLRQLSESADASSRTFEARFVLDGRAAAVPLGATVTVYIKDAAGAGEIEVPLSAIVDEGKGPAVWSLDKATSTVTYQPVRLLRLSDEGGVVSGPLRSGDQVIKVGGHFLHQGQRVRVAESTSRTF